MDVYEGNQMHLESTNELQYYKGVGFRALESMQEVLHTSNLLW